MAKKLDPDGRIASTESMSTLQYKTIYGSTLSIPGSKISAPPPVTPTPPLVLMK